MTHDTHADAPTTDTPGDTAVAVVGLSCRLPGATDPEAFWELLAQGRDAVTDAPADRRPSGDEHTPGALRGGFLDRPGDFDAGFFGISPREAAATDPSSGSSWNWSGKPWRTRASSPPTWPAHRPPSTWGHCATTGPA